MRVVRINLSIGSFSGKQGSFELDRERWAGKGSGFPRASKKDRERSASPASFISVAVAVLQTGLFGVKAANESKSVCYVVENSCEPLLWQENELGGFYDRYRN